MTIGVGWGRTLTASLASFRPSRLEGVRVMSLLGGAVDTHFSNAVEYSWRLASQMGGDCYLFPAPLIVDSVDTKQRLLEKCGLSRLTELASELDVAVVSVGDISAKATSLSRQLLTDEELAQLVDLGCVGDVMCNFLDDDGQTIPHPINDRIMSIDLDTVSKAKHIVIACGGTQRARAILSAIKRIGCNSLVTDEGAARAMLRIVEVPDSK
jgi:DNA-binding transcriptional regulator LsrR (DeoR family)